MSLALRLNDYARRFAGVLFAVYPEWVALAKAPPWPNADAGALLVRLAPPAPAVDELWVSTDGGEVTVGFGPDWHDHHGEWTEINEATSFREALAQIAGILDESLVLATGYRGGRPSASSLIPAGGSPPFRPGEVEAYDIRSRRGTHARRVPV